MHLLFIYRKIPESVKWHRTPIGRVDVTLPLAKYFQRSRSRVDSEPEMLAEAQTQANIADVKIGLWEGSL